MESCLVENARALAGKASQASPITPSETPVREALQEADVPDRLDRSVNALRSVTLSSTGVHRSASPAVCEGPARGSLDRPTDRSKLRRSELSVEVAAERRGGSSRARRPPSSSSSA